MAKGETKARAQAFFVRSNAWGFFTLAIDWAAALGLIALAVIADRALVAADQPFVVRAIVYTGSVWLIGAAQFTIGEAIMHEAAHYNLFKTKRLNDYAEILFAYPFFYQVSVYRADHFAHHRLLLGEGDYIPIIYERWGFTRHRPSILWLWLLRPMLFFFSAWFYLTIFFKPRLKMIVFWGPVLATAAYFHALELIALYWIVPMLWTFPTWLFWSETSDHLFAATGTRTKTGWFWNLIGHNQGLHELHHEYPSIPWYRLRRARRELPYPGQLIATSLLDTYRQLAAGSRSSMEAAAKPPFTRSAPPEARAMRD